MKVTSSTGFEVVAVAMIYDNFGCPFKDIWHADRKLSHFKVVHMIRICGSLRRLIMVVVMILRLALHRFFA